MYIVNSTALIPLLQKQWRTVSFSAIAADAGIAVGMSKEALKIMHQDLTSEHGFSNSWPQFIIPAMSPGKDLDAMNRRAVEVLSGEMGALRSEGPTRSGLSEWSRRIMVTATTEAVWGPQNPYRDPAIVEAWRYVWLHVAIMIRHLTSNVGCLSAASWPLQCFQWRLLCSLSFSAHAKPLPLR
jgi:hypothetical protein